MRAHGHLTSVRELTPKEIAWWAGQIQEEKRVSRTERGEETSDQGQGPGCREGEQGMNEEEQPEAMSQELSRQGGVCEEVSQQEERQWH